MADIISFAQEAITSTALTIATVTATGLPPSTTGVSSTATSHPVTTTIHSATVATASASCTTAVPGKYGYVPPDACNSYYNYSPSYAAAVAFSVLFAIVSTVHFAQAIIYKKSYCWVIIMGALWETTSFILQALGAHNQQNQAFAILSQLLLLLAPLWINAFVYMTAGRMIYFFLPEQRVFKIKALSIGKYFVWLDIFSFLVQGVGGSMLSPGSSPSTMKLGLHVYMGGIGIQEFFILCFTLLIIGFHRRMLQLEKTAQVNRSPRWRLLSYALYAVLALITMRIVYRLCEFSRGIDPKTNPLPFHEAYMLVLDAVPMWLALLILNVIHPGICLVGEGNPFPTWKEKRAMKKARKAAKKAAKEEKKAARKAMKEGKRDDEEYLRMEPLDDRQQNWT